MARKTKIYLFLSAYDIILAVVSVIIALVAVLFRNASLMLIACVILVASNLLFGAKNIRKNIVYLCFQVTFFVFLMGRPLINWIYNGSFGVVFDEVNNLKSFSELYVSQLFLIIGMRILRFTIGGKKLGILSAVNPASYDEDKLECLGKVFTVLFYVTAVFNIIETLAKIRIVEAYGYFGYYTANLGLPTVIYKLSQANEYFFLGICASFRNKRKFLLPMLIYLLEGLLTVQVGQRSLLLLRVAFIIIYFVLRSIDDPSWIGKIEKICFAASLPVIFVFIVTYSYVRIGQSYNGNGLSDAIYELFNSQGITFELLGYQQIYKDAAIMKQNFTFGELWTFLTQNVISKGLFHTVSYKQNTIEMAQYGHSFGQSISYLILKSEYLAGRGYGSTYIAELMQDYSWIGVAVINLIYGTVMKNIQINPQKKFAVNLFMCYMVVGLIYAPRSTAIGPFMSFFTFNALVANGIAWLIYKVVYKRGRANV